MDIKKIVKESVHNSLQKSGKLPQPTQKLVAENKKAETKPISSASSTTSASKVLKEAHYVVPQSFVLRTEKLSEDAKRAHERLYQGYVDKFNKTSSALDAVNKHEANAVNSDYRSLKTNETFSLNAIKLHELYFYNISDLASEISVDAIPYMRLSRDFGNFQNWQFDFMAACRSAREGWALVVYEPYKNAYMNIVIDSDDVNIPLGAIPVLVMDMWAHAYFKDYQDSKDDYIVAMMREINWDVVEARMLLAEKSDLSGLYLIKPIYNATPREMLNGAQQPPIAQVSAPGQIEGPGQSLSPTTPAAPQVASPMYPREVKPSGGF